jgi:sirohydrochlorin cobaltochelatase
MEALIIVAHGSKMKSSNDEIVNIVEKIKSKSSNISVFLGFLELTEPLFSTVLKNIIENDFKKIKIFPYFLASGKHVTQDIPEELENFRKKYPQVEFVLLPHIGQCVGIENMIISNL